MRATLFALLVMVPVMSVQAQVRIPTMPPPPAPAPPPMNDARILGTVGAADADVIEAAKLAPEKGGSLAIKNLAAMLVKDHQAALQRNTDLSKRLNIERLLPADSVMARRHKQTMEQLNLASGDAFDRVFAQYMADEHLMMVKQLKSVLIPRATNRQVKAYLNALLPTFVQHESKSLEWLNKQPKQGG